MREVAMNKEPVIDVLFTQSYLRSTHRIDVCSRTVRRWILAGLIDGFHLKYITGRRCFTTRTAIDDAVQAGRIPPPRGNPNWIKKEGEKQK